MELSLAVKVFALFGALAVAVTLAACGEDSASSISPEKPQLAMSKEEIAKLPEFKIDAPSGPAPKKLVIRDIRKGSGATVKANEDVLVNFVGANYGEEVETTPATRNKPTKYSLDEVVEGWKEGVPGMKVGGRRELVVPDAVGYENGTVVYVIDLLAVYPR